MEGRHGRKGGRERGREGCVTKVRWKRLGLGWEAGGGSKQGRRGVEAGRHLRKGKKRIEQQEGARV